MTWQLTDDVHAYAATIEPLISAEPERNTVLATVLDGLVRHGPTLYGTDPPVLAWWDQGGQAGAAALQTPPHPLQITALPGDSASELAALLAARQADGSMAAPITRINGGEPDATALAAVWCPLTGQTYRVILRQRLYRLGTLNPPEPGPHAAARIATRADAELVAAWVRAFHEETQPGAPHSSHDTRLDSGQLVLWELAGTPVSMAGVTEIVAGVGRIGTVYTPPEHRNKGYGGAVTVAATRLVIERGAKVVTLYTDLANPVSNSLYIKLGYRPVEDKVILAIERT